MVDVFCLSFVLVAFFNLTMASSPDLLLKRWPRQQVALYRLHFTSAPPLFFFFCFVFFFIATNNKISTKKKKKRKKKCLLLKRKRCWMLVIMEGWKKLDNC